METWEVQARDWWPGSEERAEAQAMWRAAYFNALRKGLIDP